MQAGISAYALSISLLHISHKFVKVIDHGETSVNGMKPGPSFQL
jgi:hypothetical protein